MPAAARALIRIGGHVHTEHLCRAQRDAGVALGGQVQPVVVPGAPVLHRAERPQVQDGAVVAVGDGPQMDVVRRDLAAHVPQHRHTAGVEPGGDHDGADRVAQIGDRALEALGQIVGVGARPDDVVAARTEADQLGGQLLGAGDLLLDYLVEEASAYGEIGVPEIPVRGILRARRGVGDREPVRQQDREPVRPADKGPVGAGVSDSFGEAVANRRVRPDDLWLIVSRIVCHKRISCTVECDLRDRNTGLTGGEIDHPVSFW
ncbi:hypothetical protein ACVWXU_002090 [Streptomyces sp. TE33382]